MERKNTNPTINPLSTMIHPYWLLRMREVAKTKTANVMVNNAPIPIDTLTSWNLMAFLVPRKRKIDNPDNTEMRTTWIAVSSVITVNSIHI